MLQKRHIGAIFVVTLVSCESPEPPAALNTPVPFAFLNAKRQIPPTLTPIFQMLKEERYKEASQLINVTLQNEPHNSTLHILNALTYEKLAERGDAAGVALAAVGYQNAINIDSRNIFAITQLGKLRYREKKYPEAQECFANALLIKPKDADLFHELAAASYYSYDIKTAYYAIKRAQELKPNDPLILRSSAMILAATGEKDAARESFAKFKKAAGADPAVEHVEARLSDWENFYNSSYLKLAQGTQEDAQGTQDGAQGTQEDLNNIQSTNYAEDTLNMPVDVTPSDADPVEGTQIIMDCYLLEIIEETATSKGQNIFDNLAVTLTPGGFTSFSGALKGSGVLEPNAQGFNSAGQVAQSTGFKANQAVPSTDVAVQTPTFTSGTVSPDLISRGSISGRVFSMGLTWAGLTYYLNIANAIESRTELVSRPSLMTFLRKQSIFFSGTELVQGLTGQYGGTLVKYPIGVTLIVTPESLEGDLVTLNITLEGSFLQTPSVQPSLSNTVQVSKSRVNTVAKMRLGETLMLSGIYQRSELYSKQGFPGLQDIPLMQYFFSNEQTATQMSSLVYMITPRSPDLVKSAVNRAATRYSGQESLKELVNRNQNWYEGSPNLVSILSLFREHPTAYYEFRTGDIVSPSWGWEPTMTDKLSSLEGFIYF